MRRISIEDMEAARAIFNAAPKHTATPSGLVWTWRGDEYTGRWKRDEDSRNAPRELRMRDLKGLDDYDAAFPMPRPRRQQRLVPVLIEVDGAGSQRIWAREPV